MSVSDDHGSNYVHRDSFVLIGGGTLGLGEAVSSDAPVTVRYEPG